VSRRISGSGTISSAIPGKIVSIQVSEGEVVTEGDVVLVLEAMKMQNEIKATIGGVIKKVNYQSGDRVEANVPLIEIESQSSEK
jgi:pyruvate carboxylase subunit B